jgi:ATP-dependent RNA helicase SUPV3L1/SUV3
MSAEENVEPQNVGFVTTYDKEDYDIVRNALKNTAPPISQAGLLPTDDIVVRFSNYFPPGTPFSYVLLRLHEIAQVSSRFFLCGLKDTLMLADAIQEVKNLTIQERLTFCKAPIPMRSTGVGRYGDRFRDFVVQCARAIAEQRGGGILDIKALELELLDEEVRAERKFLARAEALHKMLVGYLWLSFRFPGVFANRPLAIHTKRLVENVIEKSLSLFSFNTRESRRIRQQAREKELLELLQRDMLEKERVSDDEARSEHGGSKADGAEILAEAESAADELELDEELEDEEPQDVEDILRDDKSFAEEPSPEWDDEEEYPDDEDGDEGDEEEEEPDMVTRELPDDSSTTKGVNGSASSPEMDGTESKSDDLSPFDSDLDQPESKFVHDGGPLYNNEITPSRPDDESSTPSHSETAFPSGRPNSPEELARLMAQEQQRREQQGAHP